MEGLMEGRLVGWLVGILIGELESLFVCVYDDDVVRRVRFGDRKDKPRDTENRHGHV